MNGLEFVTRKAEKTRNSNDVVGREGKRLKQIEGTFLPQGKLVKRGIFAKENLLSLIKRYCFQTCVTVCVVSVTTVWDDRPSPRHPAKGSPRTK